MIFNIQRYSTHDGPGIRTVVFLKGCSLSCRWCQNPESCSRHRELLFDNRLCLQGCDLCQQAAPDVVRKPAGELQIARQRIGAEHLIALANCCPAQALTVCGEEKTAEEILTVVRRDKPFYWRSAGGMTLSGGEPFMQPQLARDLLRNSHKEGIHTAVESCLHVPWHYIQPSLPWIDLFLADLKHIDEQKFRLWTDGSAKRVMENLRKVAATGKEMIIRVPLIQGFNADQESVKSIVDFAADELHVKEIHFLPYHTLGRNKYALLNRPYLAPDLPLDCPEILQFAQSYAGHKGLAATLRG
ncbi:glycyl-radical enzyme activating protein [Pantoea sp. BAV 3049]|uniref:glycyl-radical enzyme activating protein n=1 Tax=Pantoea sp. BAV 3049 TaxID=2654188 RepID=UPI00131D9C5C|nr:glycyl-radical enzyme activating protein [Pantoea sp. BAV 3049]